jgi:NAD(P)-dependent dehydrogenase (short-subunit alcohol dehydrogenase family)
MSRARYDFSGKVALITGGASGIGAACARRFATDGAAVAIADRDQQLGDALLTEITAAGGKAAFFSLDVTDAEAVQRVVDATVAKYGRLDYAVNSAGISGESNRLVDYSLEGWHQNIDINLNGVYYAMRAEIPAMLNNGGGAIVNLGSIMSLVSSPTTPAYVAAKHAVAGLTKNAAQTYSSRGVRVTAIGPGYIETPMLHNNATDEMIKVAAAMHPIGRLGKPEEIAALALFLCSDDASFITGGIYPVDGGYLTN